MKKRLVMKNYNMILTEKQRKCQPLHQVKLINMLQVENATLSLKKSEKNKLSLLILV